MSWLSRRKRQKLNKQIKRLPLFEQGVAKFKLKYPDYDFGIGSYGMPNVHDWKEGTTLKVGAYCSIADGVRILLGGHHRADWITTFPFPSFIKEAQSIKNYGGPRGDVVIGSDVWLCQGCTILSGVTIGHGAIVATCSVVTKDIEPYSIVAGNPATIIRWRFPEKQRELLLKSEWWSWPVDEVREIAELLCSDDMSSFLEYAEQRKQSKDA
tara:strand:- start:2680 stop:3312 length:633 start_codon:yes stop_codon:yes gene_type:complete